MTPEQIEDLENLNASQYNEIGVVSADNILYRIPVYKIAKKVVLKRLDIETYHHLEETPDKFYKIRNGKPRILEESEVQQILNDTTALMEALNEGLYIFSEPLDSSYEIKDVSS